MKEKCRVFVGDDHPIIFAINTAILAKKEMMQYKQKT